jgi:hypothetical protein
MRNLWATLLFLGLIPVLILSSQAAAQHSLPVSFSADFTETETATGKPTAAGNLKAGPHGMRMEGNFETGHEPYMMIINFQERMMWNIMPAEQLYFAAPFDPASARGEEDPQRFGLGVPCPEPGAKATRLGSETLQGRMTEKWRCVNPAGETDIVWFDPKLRVPIREESDDGTIFELLNIREETFPADLFQPPPDFMEFEIPLMLR